MILSINNLNIDDMAAILTALKQRVSRLYALRNPISRSTTMRRMARETISAIRKIQNSENLTVK